MAALLDVGAGLYDMQTVLRDPGGVVSDLLSDAAPIFGVITGTVVLHDASGVVIEFVLAPWRPCAEAGFPNERVRVLVTAAHRVCVVPQDADGRRWKHRLPKLKLGDFGELCLWYPEDSAALTWCWADGLLDLLTIAHRHLQYEEYWRRHDVWPVEDAPHGDGKHAVLTAQMQEAAQQWAR